MSIVHKMPPFQNVGANQTAVLPQLPLGMTYESLILKLGGTVFTKALITGIRVRMQGKQFIDVTGDNLDEINKWLRHTADVAYLEIPFGDPNARTVIGQLIGAIDTSFGVDDFSIEVDIGAATAPTLVAWAKLSPPMAESDPNRSIIRALLKTTHAISAAGEFSQPIPLGSLGGAALKRLFLFHANVTKVQVTKDGLWLQQEGETALIDFVQERLHRTAVAGLQVFDPTFENNQSDRVPTLRPNGQPATFEFKFTTSASDTIVTYSDIYASIDRV